MSISIRIRPIGFFLSFLLASVAIAQDGVSTAGAARARYLGNLGLIPAAREVAVEDFVNYHRHEIGRPKAGEAVALDLRWGSNKVSSSKEAVLQVGLSTALAHDRKQLRPLNLSLVIDKSGSMGEANKLVRVKSALLTLMNQLRPTDTLSIIAFDSEAEVVLSASRVGDREAAKSIIQRIEPGSTTNINAGLMLGYQEALKNFSKEATNRVILLTDGIANRGVTNPDEIAKASLGYNDRGVDLSTIGVGLDLNKDLLSTLAKSGRGLFHFVADSEDIDKVFAKEAQSLLSPVASEPNLEIEYGPGLELEKVYGYEPKIGGNSVKIKLDTMNSGMTEVVLLRFKTRGEKLSALPVKVRLSYYDLDGNKTVETTQKVTVNAGGGSDMLQDSSVAKNYSIAVLAQSIRDMATACEAKKYREAEAILNTAIEKTSKRYPNLDDEDIKRTLAIAQKYQEALQKENLTNGERDGVQTNEDNLIQNGDFSLGNWGFTSPGLAYTDPTENSLWPAGYTVAPRFNSPHLHRLVSAEEFTAVKRPKGNEQVLFANAGGTEAMVIWTAQVTCKPNTTYRISFQSISLTPGREWIPTFEIRINGERSEPQIAGAGVYGEVSMKWDSKKAKTATISIVRMPIPHGGGLIGISNIEMIKKPVIL